MQQQTRQQEDQEAVWASEFSRMGRKELAGEVSSMVQRIDLANRGIEPLTDTEWRRMQMLILTLQEQATASLTPVVGVVRAGCLESMYRRDAAGRARDVDHVVLDWDNVRAGDRLVASDVKKLCTLDRKAYETISEEVS